MDSQVFLVSGECGGELVGLWRELGLVEAEGLDELGVGLPDAVVDVGEQRDMQVLHPDLRDVLELRRKKSQLIFVMYFSIITCPFRTSMQILLNTTVPRLS